MNPYEEERVRKEVMAEGGVIEWFEKSAWGKKGRG